MGNREMELAAVMKVRDEMSGPMAAAAQKGVAAVDALAKSDEKLAQSTAKVTQETTARMSASKQAELAIRAEADADNYLQSKIANLNQEYGRLKAQAAAQIRATGQIKEETLKAAAAVKEKAENFTILEQALSRATGGLSSMQPKMALLTGAIGLASLAAAEFNDILRNTDTSLRAMANGITYNQALSLSFKELEESTKGGNWAQRNVVPYLDAVFGDPFEKLEAAKKLVETQKAMAEEAEKQKRFNADFTAQQKERAEQEQKAAADDRAAMDASIANTAKLAAAERARLENAKKIAAEKDKAAKAEAATLASIFKDMDELSAKQEAAAEKDAAAKEKAELAHSTFVMKLDEQIVRKKHEIEQANDDRRRQVLEASTQQQIEMAGQVGTAMGAAMGALISGSERADRVLIKMGLNIAAMVAKVAIIQALGQGIAGAFGVGLLGGVFGGIGALFAEGGWVEGGTQGRDSVKAMLMPGEYVVSVGDVQRARQSPDDAVRLMNRIIDGGNSGGSIRDRGVRHYADGGYVGTPPLSRAPSPGRGGIVVNINTIEVPPGDELRRFLRRAMPIMRELEREGHG